ncbi:hypothetical protein [Cyanothece sp. BG0011]|uniref:hypothetical protein n=1 Tax=Cyanothece sp. BG0011 TaxID=2082950 RepID=UPI000D1D8E7B|nr:hypothetical protein [Cyanothece sp. BG0011]
MEKLELIKALMERKDIHLEAKKAFRLAYPNAPDKMIDTAIFHIYVDGIHAALDWLTEAELFLQNPENTITEGSTFHLIYHLYNWLQFKTLLQDTKEDIVEKLNDVKAALEDDDKDAAFELLEELKEQFNGGLNAPSFWSP